MTLEFVLHEIELHVCIILKQRCSEMLFVINVLPPKYSVYTSVLACVAFRNNPVPFSPEPCWSLPVVGSRCVPVSIWRCELARLMGPWVNETEEDKAAFMAYTCSGLHTYSLRESFRLLISHQGISAHLIPPGIHHSRLTSGKVACVDGQSTFDQT